MKYTIQHCTLFYTYALPNLTKRGKERKKQQWQIMYFVYFAYRTTP